MPNQQPTMTTANGQRPFSCSAVALQAIIVNPAEQILLLSSPRRNRDGAWQVVSGALEAEETILAGTLREVREEVGPHVQVRPLGTMHVFTFRYDENIQYMIGIYTLLAYAGGPVQPGDDMAGSEFRWWGLSELAAESVRLYIPPNEKWILNRAVELYRLWKDQTVTLQAAY